MLIAAFITTAIIFTSIGFISGAAWKALHQEDEHGDIDITGSTLRCTMRSPKEA